MNRAGVSYPGHAHRSDGSKRSDLQSKEPNVVICPTWVQMSSAYYKWHRRTLLSNLKHVGDRPTGMDPLRLRRLPRRKVSAQKGQDDGERAKRESGAPVILFSASHLTLPRIRLTSSLSHACLPSSGCRRITFRITGRQVGLHS
jgi:hypothetical protein